jgi:hypothetical protein
MWRSDRYRIERVRGNVLGGGICLGGGLFCDIGDVLEGVKVLEGRMIEDEC